MNDTKETYQNKASIMQISPSYGMGQDISDKHLLLTFLPEGFYIHLNGKGHQIRIHYLNSHLKLGVIFYGEKTYLNAIFF